MIDELVPYPAMKDSGVFWLGEVPAGWEVRRLRNIAEMRVSSIDKHSRDGEEPVRLCNYVDVYNHDYIRSDMPFMRATATRDEIYRFRLRANDVLITKDSEAWNDIGVPALVAQSAEDLVSGYHLALLRPRRANIIGEYLLRALQSTGVQYQFHVEATGVTRYGLSHRAIKSIALPMPPLPEQSAIVRFLDHADRRIRRYIRAKQKLIKLLEEQKQAIIHRAVTRGLDPKVRLKPSGVEWLGDVPEHWEVQQLRRLVRRGRRITYGIVQPGEPDPSGRFMIRGQDYSFGWTSPEMIFRVSNPIETPYKRSRLRTGDLLLTIVGAGVGNVAIVPEWLDGANITQTTARISIDPEKADGAFVAAALRGPIGRRNVELYVKGAAQPGLNLEHVRVFLIPVPPVGEQIRIGETIKRSAASLDTARDRSIREIGLLRELRTRLIADVVTGKFDVREAARRLPDEPEDFDSLDDTDAEPANPEDLDAALAEVDG